MFLKPKPRQQKNEELKRIATTTMRWLLSFLLLGLLSVVEAVSSSGNRLLVVLDDLAEKAKYSKYIADLEGMRIALAQLALRFLQQS